MSSADCTIVGNTISRGNAELEEVLNRKLLYRSQAEIVKEEFIRGRRVSGYCGNARQDDDDEYCDLGCGMRRFESVVFGRRNRAEFRRVFSRCGQRFFCDRRRRI